MRRTGWLLAASGSLALVAASSAGGCAFVYGYGGYHSRGNGGGGAGTTSSSQGGGGNGGGGNGAGGVGGTGGTGPACPAGPGGDPYELKWAGVYGNGADVSIAGVHVDGAGNVSLAGTFTGSMKVGKPIDGGSSKAMLIAQFKPSDGAPSATNVVKGMGDVIATTLAVDASGDPFSFATFDGETTVHLTDYPDPGAGNSFALEVGVTKGTSDVLMSRDIECQPATGGAPFCSVSIASAQVTPTALLLAGSFIGRVFLDDNHTMANALTNTEMAGSDGFASIFGTKQFWLEGATGTQTMSAFFQTASPTTYLLFGTVKGPSDIVGCGSTNDNNNDLFAMKLDSSSAALWSCPGILQASGEQYLDGAVVLSSGDVVIAGRTDGPLNIPTMPIDSGPAGVFVARLAKGNGNVVWRKVLPMTAESPVHIEVAADDSLLLSGSFSGALKDEQDKSIHSSGGVNGFVATLDAVTPGTLRWIRAVSPCAGEMGPTSAIASWTDTTTIAIAGTVAGTSTIAGGRIESPEGGTHFYVARLDAKQN